MIFNQILLKKIVKSFKDSSSLFIKRENWLHINYFHIYISYTLLNVNNNIKVICDTH